MFLSLVGIEGGPVEGPKKILNLLYRENALL